MVWIKNISIGNVRVSDLGVEFEFDEVRWVDSDDFKESKSLKEKLRKGFLTVSKHKPTPSQTEPTKKRKKALNPHSNFFPFGKANLRQGNVQAEKQIKDGLKKALKVKEGQLKITIDKPVDSEKIEQILTSQSKTNELLEKLATQGISVDVTKEIEKKEETQYIPEAHIEETKANLPETNSVTTIKSSELDDAGEQLKKLRKGKKSSKSSKKEDEEDLDLSSSE